MRVDERVRAGGRGREDSTDYFFNPPRAGRADAPQPALAPQLSHRGSQPLLRSCLTGGVDGKCKWGGRCEWMGLMRVDEEMRGEGQEP